jgi:superfamily II DNA helicase RecQ
MAAMAKACVNTALEKLNILRHCQRKLILKKEQEIAIENLLLGNDVLAVLPTSFGKSMIFTVFLLAKQEIERRNMNKDLRVNISTSCILVITLLTSITSDQIAEMESLGFKALELSDKTVNDHSSFIEAQKTLQVHHSSKPYYRANYMKQWLPSS